MLELIIGIISYFLGVSTTYLIINKKVINNKININGNKNKVINGVDNENK